jgi:hypothetical protein
MVSGRRGVLDLGEAFKIINKKLEDKEKFYKMAEKYSKDFNAKGTTFASLKDLV